MASIDKIYATKSQAEEFKAWCKKHNLKIAAKIYTDFEEYGEVAIADLSAKEDMWLIKHCNIDFVVERLKAQYDIETEKDWEDYKSRPPEQELCVDCKNFVSMDCGMCFDYDNFEKE